MDKDIILDEVFLKHFKIHYRLLVDRYEKYASIDKLDKADYPDLSTYFDMIIVQLRAMCIENPKNGTNYTIQNVLNRFNKEEYAKRIDDMLDMEFLPATCHGDGESYSTRKAIKTLADKFICHYDNFDAKKDEWAFGLVLENRFMNPYIYPNLDSVMKVIIDNVHDGIIKDLRFLE